MAARDWFPSIRGIMNTLFQVGKGGPQIKNNAGVIEFKNAADAAFAIARSLDPVGNDDVVNLRYFNANNAASVNIACVKMPLVRSTKVSTSSLPDNVVIVRAIIDVTTAYDASATYTLKRTGDASVAPMGVSDSDLSTIGTYAFDQILSWGSTGAGTLTATLANSPTVGASVVYIFYVTPIDIS